MIKRIYIISLTVILFLISGCGKKSSLSPTYLDGYDNNNNTSFVLYSTNEGIYPDKSVLEDPNNIFAESGVDSTFKWEIASYGSSRIKFYAWATVLANEPWGEPQYYVGAALEELASLESSTVLTQQAIRAYQSVLDNFTYDKTDTTGNGDYASLGIWAYKHIESLGGTPVGYVLITDSTGNEALVKY